MQIKTYRTFSLRQKSLYQEILNLTMPVSETYPEYVKWYHQTFLKGLQQGKRGIVATFDKGKLVGVDFDKFLTEDDLPSIPTKVSDIDNDLHYVTEDELRNYVPEIEIDGSDVDEIIEEKVTEKLTWNVIKT